MYLGLFLSFLIFFLFLHSILFSDFLFSPLPFLFLLFPLSLSFSVSSLLFPFFRALCYFLLPSRASSPFNHTYPFSIFFPHLQLLPPTSTRSTGRARKGRAAPLQYSCLIDLNLFLPSSSASSSLPFVPIALPSPYPCLFSIPPFPFTWFLPPFPPSTPTLLHISSIFPAIPIITQCPSCCFPLFSLFHLPSLSHNLSTHAFSLLHPSNPQVIPASFRSSPFPLYL